MAGLIPNVPGTGNKVPVDSYIAGISESYPNANRQRVVESSINSRECLDFMPSNMGLNQTLTDRYMDFRIHGVTGSFIDMSSLVLEMCIKVTKGGDELQDADNIMFVNGLSNTIFKSVTVFLNEKMVESNPIYGYTSFSKLLKSCKRSTMYNIGKCGFFYDDASGIGGIKDVFLPATFTTADSLEGQMSRKIKSEGINICFPLLLDLCSLDMYLLDSVDVRIRLEMANNSWIMNTNEGGATTKVDVQMAKLWLDRVTPHYNSILALNDALTINPIQYIFNKTLHKTYVIGSYQNSILIEQPFGSCIPEKIGMMLVDMRNFSGDYMRNPLFLKNCDLSNIHITINGSTIYNINCEFPNNISNLYYITQKSLGLAHENMISYDSFSKGRTLMYFNFITEDMDDALPVEMSASMRINLKLRVNVASPVVVILLAETTGLLTIDSARSIVTDVRG